MFDIPVGNADVRFTAQKIPEFIASGNKNLADLPAALVKFQVGNSSKLSAIPHVDYVFTFQFGKSISEPFFQGYDLFYARD